MIAQPTVSVIVPVYNTGPCLSRCLESLINQTLQDIEIICVDDRSTDDSLKILRRYAAYDERIRIVTLSRNSGVATARNRGIDIARGQYIGFVDSDDYVDHDFYEKVYSVAVANDADIACGMAKMIENDKAVVLTPIDDTNNKWRFIWCFWSAVYRTDMVKNFKIDFPKSVISGQDLVFLTRCVHAAGSIYACGDTFYNYVRRDDSLDSVNVQFPKLRSKIKAIDMVVDIYNRADMKEADYMHCFDIRWGQMVQLINRADGIRGRLYLAQAIRRMYKNCKYKKRIKEEAYIDKYPLLYTYRECVSSAVFRNKRWLARLFGF